MSVTTMPTCQANPVLDCRFHSTHCNALPFIHSDSVTHDPTNIPKTRENAWVHQQDPVCPHRALLSRIITTTTYTARSRYWNAHHQMLLLAVAHGLTHDIFHHHHLAPFLSPAKAAVSAPARSNIRSQNQCAAFVISTTMTRCMASCSHLVVAKEPLGMSTEIACKDGVKSPTRQSGLPIARFVFSSTHSRCNGWSTSSTIRGFNTLSTSPY